MPGNSLFQGLYAMSVDSIGHAKTKALVATLVLLNELRAALMVASIGSEFFDITMWLPNWFGS